ncbi:MAG TPA: substrate-binding domain-containing protein [Candidatus Dormibacteraeota bacterium]
MIRRSLAAALTPLLVSTVAAACDFGASVPTVHVLAGSELKDMAPILSDLQTATGYHMQLDYVGSLDGAEQIVNGTNEDMAWFSTAKYLQLLPGGASKLVDSQQIMLSPVVLGVKHSVAQRFGWSGNPNVTWADIQARSKAGDFHFGMTNPTASNSGFVALVGVAEALASPGAALNSGNINIAGLQAFFNGQSLTAGSSGFLADSYVRQQDSVDGMINYESILLSLNQGTTLHEKLDLIYPKDGIATADYPLMLLNRSQRPAYDKITAYLKRPDVQNKIMTTVNRRPGVPGIQPDSRFPSAVLIELPFPSSLDVVNQLLLAYLSKIRRPAHDIYVLDTSGSMQGSRLDSLKKAFLNLTGADQSITGQFAQFQPREEVTILPFNGRVYDQRTFTVNDVSPNSPDLAAIRNYVNNLQAADGTAIYDAVFTGYQVVQQSLPREPDRFFSIVLMTDGENNNGRDGAQFTNDYNRLPPEVRAVHTFPIVFGEASPSELNAVAAATGGQVFDGRSASLAQVFKQIRGYQ